MGPYNETRSTNTNRTHFYKSPAEPADQAISFIGITKPRFVIYVSDQAMNACPVHKKARRSQTSSSAILPGLTIYARHS